jgi:hypothetical protein
MKRVLHVRVRGVALHFFDELTVNIVCALHVVSPRGRWLCVLPRWRMNVNVNVTVNTCFGVLCDEFPAMNVCVSASDAA